jgi:hypothetical protein
MAVEATKTGFSVIANINEKQYEIGRKASETGERLIRESYSLASIR